MRKGLKKLVQMGTLTILWMDRDTNGERGVEEIGQTADGSSKML